MTTSSRKGKTKMSAIEILHYYSSSSEKEHIVPSPTVQKKKSKAFTTKAATAEPTTEKNAAVSDSEDSDVAITKEVRIGGSRTRQRMA